MRKKAKKATPDPRHFLLEQIEQSGSLRMLHARFLTNLLTEISNSELKRILPAPHTSSGIADDIAATLVIKYLEKHQLLNSITALSIESQGSIQATHSTHALHFTSRHKSMVQLLRSRRAHIESDYSQIKTGIAMKLLELAGDKIYTQAVRTHLIDTVQKSMAHKTPAIIEPIPRKPRKSKPRISVKSKSKSKPAPEPEPEPEPSGRCKWKWANSLDLEDTISGLDSDGMTAEFVGFNSYVNAELSPIKEPIGPVPEQENDTKEPEFLEEESGFSMSDFSPPPTPLPNADHDEVFIMKEANGRGPDAGFVVTKCEFVK